jgi:glycosyltransferase involved in cell wall biosynthesis
MNILLCYNSYDSVSGETTFFNNMKSALEGSGNAVQVCAVKQSTSGLAGKFGYYSRYPLLHNASKELKKFRGYDAVHFLNAALAPAGSSIKTPKIATAHFLADSYLELSPPSGFISRAAESAFCRYVSMLDKKAFGKLEALVACTKYQEQKLRETYSLDNVRTIYTGVDVAYFQGVEKIDLKSRYDSENVIVYLGRLHERSKGVSYLIKAMDYLEKTKLLVIGDGPDRGYYERLAKGKNIEFLGKLGWGEKCRIQKSADAVVMPSLYEVFGTVFAESLACEVPVVAFDLPFWKGLYDGAGIFVEKNPKSLADGILTALQDGNTRQKAVSRGKEYMKTYDLSKTISDYLALYSEILF